MELFESRNPRHHRVPESNIIAPSRVFIRVPRRYGHRRKVVGEALQQPYQCACVVVRYETRAVGKNEVQSSDSETVYPLRRQTFVDAITEIGITGVEGPLYRRWLRKKTANHVLFVRR